MLSKILPGKIHSNVTYHLHSFIHLALCTDSILIYSINCRSRKTYVVLTVKCTVICHCGTCHSVNHLSSVSTLFKSERHSVTHVTYFPLCKELWSRMARKTWWLAYCKIRPDVVEHPGTSGILHFTYYSLGLGKFFSGIPNSKVVWVLEHREQLSYVLSSPLANLWLDCRYPSLYTLKSISNNTYWLLSVINILNKWLQRKLQVMGLVSPIVWDLTNTAVF